MFNQNQLHTVETNSPVPAPVTPTSKEVPGKEPAGTIENTEIYYMPDNFRKNNQVAGKKIHIPGSWVLIITIFLLIGLGGGLYVYWLHPSFLSGLFGSNEPASTEIPYVPEVITDTEVPALDSTETPAGSAKETYLAFRVELAGVTTPEAFLAVYSKYATAGKYDSLRAEKDRLELSFTENEVLSKLRELGSPMLDGTEDINETSSDTETTLTITKTNNRESGKVVFISEEGQWKISQEIWNKETAATTEPEEPQPGVDEDQDGLTNEEEIALGTNAKVSDSDGDGYTDLAEINNDYNPTGAGKLSQNKNLATYLNTTFNFNLLYPQAWKKTAATSDDSIMFSGTDNQFIQVLIQPNTDREDITDWYKKTYEVDTIPTTQLLTTTDWTGVRSPDGLTAFLTNKDKSYIFVVTYNLGSNKILNYQVIFELMLRSLKLTV